VHEAFYERDGELLVATQLTRGPWDPGAQHAGPPTALLGREIERLPEAGEFRLGRITGEILRPVPIAPLRAAARVARPGRRVQMVEAELSDEAGETYMRARAWRIRPAALELPAEVIASAAPAAGPERGTEKEFFPTGEEVGYHSAIEARFISGAWLSPGPAKVWMRMRQPLVGGEQPSPLQRLLVAADVGNGVSASLDYERYLFINVDLTVHLERMPAGEWICIDAQTLPEPDGIGTAEAVLSDGRGRIGRASQTLLIAAR
jgi:hypothetical protein